MATIKTYYNAVISHQNDTWKGMYKDAVLNFGGDRSGKKCAKAYVICYNALYSGAYGLIVDNICIPDANECVEGYIEHKKLKFSDEERRKVVFEIYNELHPDAEITMSSILEYAR